MNEFPPHSLLDAEIRETLQGTLLMSDPPEHTRLRRLVNRAFTPNAVARMRPKVEELTGELIGDMTSRHRAGGDVDFVADLAAPLPIYVIGEMLGLPAEDRDFVKRTSDELVRLLDGVVGFDLERMTRAVRTFWEYLDDIFEQRRRSPRQDMITALVEVEDDGDRLSRVELRGLVMLLMAAGHETTTSLLSNSIIALQRHPEQRERLRTDPGIVDNAVEELLRYDSPVQSTDRLVVADMNIADRRIEAGDLILVLLGAANRDPRRFERPHELDLGRRDVRPLSFGHGVHHCLGAALARMEAAVALPAFLEAFPDHRVTTDGLSYKTSWTLRGPESVPVRLGRSAQADRPAVHAS
jgi:hypothetical protein